MINYRSQKGFIQIPLFSFLALAMRPLVVQLLTLLGIGLISFTGVTTAINLLVTNARGSYAAMPSAIIQLADLAGFGEAFGIIVAAILVRVAINFMPKWGRLPT